MARSRTRVRCRAFGFFSVLLAFRIFASRIDSTRKRRNRARFEEGPALDPSRSAHEIRPRGRESPGPIPSRARRGAAEMKQDFSLTSALASFSSRLRQGFGAAGLRPCGSASTLVAATPRCVTYPDPKLSQALDRPRSDDSVAPLRQTGIRGVTRFRALLYCSNSPRMARSVSSTSCATPASSGVSNIAIICEGCTVTRRDPPPSS